MPKKVYLRPADWAKKSAFHTSYAGDGPVHEDGKSGALYKLEFVNGVAYDVSEELFQRFKDLGIADVKRPSRGEED